MPATRVPQRRRRPWWLLCVVALVLVAFAVTTALGGFEPAATKLQGKEYTTKQQIQGARWAFMVDGAAVTQDRYDDQPSLQVVFQAGNRASKESLYIPPDMVRVAIGGAAPRKADRVTTDDVSDGGQGLVSTYIAVYALDPALPAGDLPVRLVIWDEAPPKNSFLSSGWNRNKPLANVPMTALDTREQS